MLTLPTIQRCHRTRDHERLLRALRDNGTILPLPLQVRLSSLPMAVMALGLRRVVELSYGPTPLSREMLAALLDWWRVADAGRGVDPLATAALAAAIAAVLRDQPQLDAPSLRLAKREAIASLAAAQAEDGLFDASDDRTDADRRLTSAFILYLLNNDEDFLSLVRVGELSQGLADGSRRRDDASTLFQLARASATPSPLARAA